MTSAFNPALSTIKRVEGGAFGKEGRFSDAGRKVQTPGPIYSPPGTFDGKEHVTSPVYKKNSEGGKLGVATGVPHPGRDRTAWLIGTTKNEMAYYSDIASTIGPAAYKPSVAHDSTKPTAPVANFPKNPRFSSLTHRYMSKEHNEANLCTASPGPRYYPEKSHLDFRAKTAPAHSFGSNGMTDRSKFIQGVIKNGYLYNARPATSDNHTNVGPANYSPQPDQVQSTAPRPKWSKADRFRTNGRIFISKKHAKTMGGLHSPGPQYYPKNYDMGDRKEKPGTVAPGVWSP